MDSGSYLCFVVRGKGSEVRSLRRGEIQGESISSTQLLSPNFQQGEIRYETVIPPTAHAHYIRTAPLTMLPRRSRAVNFVEWKRWSGALSNCGGGMPDDPPPFQRFHCGGTIFDCGHDKRSIDRWSVRHFGSDSDTKTDTKTDTDTDTDALLALPINSQSSPQHEA